MVATASGHLMDGPRARIAVAVLATMIGVRTLITYQTPELAWPLVVPTVAIYWLWAIREGSSPFVLCAFGFVTPMVLNLVEKGDEVSMFFVVLSIAVIAATAARRQLVVGCVLGIVAIFAILTATRAITDFGWPNWLFGAVFSWGAGEIIYRYSQLVDELERTRSLAADQAAAHERRRIARDVHDLVGHSLSVVMLHVTGARHLVHRDPQEAERALEQAEQAGRESLAEIRRTVSLLRDHNDDLPASEPSPELLDVSTLVAEFDDAGLSTSLRIDGDLGRVDGAAGLAGYRIIQEALTNAARHAPGCVVEVLLVIDTDSYELRVRNEGGTLVGRRDESGFGLVSMRERARSVDGSLIAGPSGDGWIVEATIPLQARTVSG